MSVVLATLLPILMLVVGSCLPGETGRWRASPVRYVALGASDSVGVGARDAEREGWVYQVYSRLPAGSKLINLGISGSRIDQAIDQQLPVALAADPELITVWLAVNDLNARVPLERYAADLDRLLGSLEQTRARVLVGNVPDLAQLAAYRGVDPALVRNEVDSWNAVIASTTLRHGALLVDLHASWTELAQHPEYIASDGFHPSSEGHARLAELYWQTLEAGSGLTGSGHG
jgi:acyl-CoA thioesterase-1